MKAKITNLTKEREDRKRKAKLEDQRIRDLLKQIKLELPEGFDGIVLSQAYSIQAVKHWKFRDHVLHYLTLGLWMSIDISEAGASIANWQRQKYDSILSYLHYEQDKNKITIHRKEVWVDNQEFLTNNFKEVVLNF